MEVEVPLFVHHLGEELIGTLLDIHGPFLRLVYIGAFPPS